MPTKTEIKTPGSRPLERLVRPEREYFIRANSFAAPFFSDDSSEYVTAATPEEALKTFAKEYAHPCGLYAAVCYDSADAYHKGKEPLARWLCNHEQEKQRITKGMGSYSMLGHAPGRFEINGELHEVKNPKEGGLVPV